MFVRKRYSGFGFLLSDILLITLLQTLAKIVASPNIPNNVIATTSNKYALPKTGEQGYKEQGYFLFITSYNMATVFITPKRVPLPPFIFKS